MLFLAGCKVERTPEQYIDHADPLELERAAAAAELTDRILALGAALTRGSPSEAVAALSPASDAYLLGPQAGIESVGTESITALVQSLGGEPMPVDIRDVQVTVGPTATVAWFRAVLDLKGVPALGEGVRMTGVFIRREGAWRLVQAHVSAPTTPAAAPAPAEDSASAQAGS